MTLRAQLVNVKQLAAGSSVSYGWTWTADQPTTVGLVPIGYGDGVPRHASNRAQVGWQGGRAPVRGRICMDQFVVDLGAGATAEPGDEVLLFGPGEHGEPTAEDWAGWCDTIGYEIVTRVGTRVPRRYPHGPGEHLMAPRLGEGLGLVAGFAAVAAGGIALGLELERRIVAKRILRSSVAEVQDFFALRSPGVGITTPDGVVLHTETDDGEAEDLTLVFVHGYALSLDCWHFQRAHFRGAIRQIFYDQRSHGRSSRSAPELCRIPQLASDLLQVLDEVAGDGPLVLVGHSMGGMTIMRLAQTHPELFGTRIKGVALFSTSAGEMADYSPIRGLPGRTFSRVAEPLMATLNRIPELVERGRRAGSDLGYVVTRRMAFGSQVPVSYVEFASEMLAETPLEVVADFYPAFAELNEFVALQHLAGVETAVVGGETDAITPIQHTARIIELLPHAETLAGARLRPPGDDRTPRDLQRRARPAAGAGAPGAVSRARGD